jgi:chemotaxis protein methyltransferase CheR
MNPLDRVHDDQLAALLENIIERYGFDFRNYAPASLRRRVSAILSKERLESVLSLQERVLADPIVFQRFVHTISVNVTSMFRDPTFYLTFRRLVVPVIATYPFIRIWHAGCSTGEEVYSIAIVLHEEGLYDRTRMYATDLDALAVEQAKEAIFPLSAMKEYSANYLNGGGHSSLSQYYTADRENALFRSFLKKNIVFAPHNLVCDSSFNEFQVILCRNVLIYFDNILRERVLSLMHDSLVRFGILVLGSKESLRFSDIEACYEQIDAAEKIYKRII